MQELIVKHKFDLVSNMDEVRESIAEEISKYDLIIEEDKLPEAKVLMATLNKEKKEFSDTCKEFIKIVSEPIAIFKSQQKEIEALYDNGREKIANQVKKFETTKLIEIEKAILDYLNVECALKNINPDSVPIKDLIMISAVSGMNITRKTKDAVLSRIQLIENEILKAKVEAQEKAARDAEIAEKARIETEERMKQREIKQAIEFERQKQEALREAELVKQKTIEQAKQREIEFEVEKQKAVQEALKPKIEDTKIADNGQKIFVLNARFELSAPWNSDKEKLCKMLEKRLSDFKSLISVTCLN